MTQKTNRLAVEHSINTTNFQRLLKTLRYRVTGTLALLLCVGGFYFLLQEPKPPDLSGLVPLRLPIDFDNASRNVARFASRYTEPHYVGFEMTRKTLLSDRQGTFLEPKTNSRSITWHGKFLKVALCWRRAREMKGFTGSEAQP